MAKVQVFNVEGKELESINLDDRFFSLPENGALLKEAYSAISANERIAIAHTKGRGERAGSGKKPWKQKHTGRARAGSVRSPLWRKGGVVFGPKRDQNFSKKMNRKAGQKAFFIAISGKVRDKELLVVDSLDSLELKTKSLAQLLNGLNVLEKSVVLGFLPEEREIEKIGRNISRLLPRPIHTLNTKDILDHRYILMSRSSIAVLSQRAERSFLVKKK